MHPSNPSAASLAPSAAQRAGVSKGTLYLYYPNKEELFKAVVRQSLSRLIAQAHEMTLTYEGSSSGLLAELMRIWWERLGDTPAGGIHKIVVAEVRNFPELAQFYTDEVILPAHRLFNHCVQRGIDRGEFRDVPLDGVSKSLIAPLLFLVLHRHSFDCCPVKGLPQMDPIEFLHTSLNLMLRGLEVRHDTAAGRA